MTLIVPYRDRAEHLEQLVARLSHHDIIIVEQADERPFNRGKLINIGFLQTMPDIFVANDIDMIGTYPAYVSLKGINQLCKSDIQQVDYLGGATMYDRASFPGYHNDFFHRAEDNEMMFHVKRNNIHVSEWDFEFDRLPHERTGPEFIPWLWQKAQRPRSVDMLKTCHYSIISKDQMAGYMLIKAVL